ncbi:unnamed protein product [Sphagnum jensenii]|uniref:Alpha/beta hydrolase fold-5 domain-containing protein n=1 Tax=Sphagnum jensenii TaxID=128206 RepID=A0ABP0VMY8_9BRYO
MRPADNHAMAAMRGAADNVSVSYTRGIGYSFVNTANSVTIPFTPGIPYSFVNTGGDNITLGMVILPELGVAPEAYAVYARQIALYGYYAVIVENATVEHVVCAMMQLLHVEYWTLLGHGNNGGVVAARLAVTLQPKVKGLILLAAALPGDLDTQALNLLLIVIYGGKDTLVTPEMITKSFSRMAGDTSTLLFPNLGHFDFVHSKCKGNDLHPSCNRQGGLTSNDAVCIAQYLLYSLYYSQWEVASAKALSYGDNEKLTPGHNDSKSYPGDIHVKFTEFPIPGTSPQRVWWIFTPSQIRGGLIYYPGAAVDGRAYFPLAFEIAARGHMVVIVQLPLRNAGINFADANVVLNSNISAFSVVPEDRWAIGGHSLGGLGASLYAGAYGNQVYAAVFHAGGWLINLTQSELPVLQMYGTLDDIFSGGYERYRYLYVDPPPKGFGPLVNLNTTEFIPIVGANHYQNSFQQQCSCSWPCASMD